MTDNPNDPAKSGTRPPVGQQPSKRPNATIDLKATEIERRDIPGSAGSTASGASAEPPKASDSKPETAGTSSTAKAADPGATKAAPPPPPAKPPRQSSGIGSFVSHLLAGVAGAAAAIFGADYLANTLGLNIPTYSAGQVEQLTRRMADMELATKEHGTAPTTNLLKEQIEALRAKLDQTAGATAAIDGLKSQQQQLAERAAKAEQAMAAQAANTAPSDRIAKLEDQFRLMAESGAAGKGGQPGQMAALVAKLDTIGVTLDERLAEMRKSLQGDMQKQSAHFEDRLAEVDKGMAVETLKASGKSLGDEIVGIKASAGKIAQDLATVEAGNKQLRQDLGTLKQTTTDLATQLQSATGSFAKTDQLSSVNAATSKLQADLAAIAARDQSRELGANRILLSLQLANLKRVVERGGAYAAELAEVKRIAPKELDLSALEASAEKGLPTATELAAQFKDMTWNVVNAGAPSEDGSLIGQLWQGARSVVQVRKTGNIAGDGSDAIVARAEARLKAGDLEGAAREAEQLKGDARKIADPWLARLAARLSLDRGLASIDASLVKLMGPSGTN
jgi:hypothetical protein